MKDDPERMVELALGLLEGDERRELERDLAGSGEARAELARLERSVAELGAAADPLAASRELRERLLRSLDPVTRFEGFAERLAAFLDLGLARTRELLASLAAAGSAPWEDDLVAGVRLLHFAGGPRVAGADCGLVRCEPGVLYPRHLHRGDEWAFVLQGEGLEDSGRRWQPGDLIRNPAGSAHSFRSVGEEPFVFAIVLREGIRFSDE
jgi:quercetin dioxygenase-like cupin family protein